LECSPMTGSSEQGNEISIYIKKRIERKEKKRK
jgi:hypothetical protein